LSFWEERILKLDVSPLKNLADIVSEGSVTESGLLAVPFMAEKINCFFNGVAFCALVENIPLKKMAVARTIFFM
jgi:hypothetical protein